VSVPASGKKGEDGPLDLEEAAALLGDDSDDLDIDPQAETTESPAFDADDFPAGRCTLCGWRNMPSDALCEGCGSNLETGEPPAVERFQPRRFDSRFLAVGGMFLLAVVLAFGVWAWARAGVAGRAIQRGFNQLEAGDAVAAEASYRQALAYDDQSVDSWAGLSEALLQQPDKLDAGLNAARRARELAPAAPVALAAHARALAIAGDDRDAALLAIHEALEADPKLPDLRHFKADLLLAKVEHASPQDARVAYQEALERDGASKRAPMSRLRLAQLLTRFSRLAEAERYLREAERGGAPPAEILAARGDILARRDDPRGAIQAYEQGLQADPGNAGLHHRIAVTELDRLGRAEEALEAVDRAIAIEDRAAFYTLRGRALLALDKTDEAHEALSRAVARDRRDASSLRLLARIELGRRQYSKARAHLDVALAADAGSAETLDAIAQVAVFQGDLDTAITMLQRAVDLRPLHAPYHFRLGEAYLKRRNRVEAIGAFRQSADLKKDFEAPRRQLASIHLEDGHFNEAARSLEELVKLRPGDVEDAVRLARLYVRHTEPRRYVEAIELLDAVIAKQPDHEEAKRLKRQADVERFSGGG
jgi:tetratricopeptide (TPR) repeat protein